MGDSFMLNENERRKIIDSSDFFYFVSAEFDKAVADATNEEIAEFAFGDLDEAIEAFLNKDEKNETT